MLLQRQKITDGSATAKALDYSLNRWAALTRFVDDGQLPVDNNWIENRIRPIATGRKNWLFAGSLRAGKRAAAIMSLIQSAKLNGHDPFLYLKDILSRLPTQPNSQISELLPHTASCADDIAVIRSMHCEHNNHEQALWQMHTGRIVTGRVFSGSIKPNQSVKVLDREEDKDEGEHDLRQININRDKAFEAGVLMHELSHVALNVFGNIHSDPRAGNGEPYCYLVNTWSSWPWRNEHTCV